MCKTNKKCNIIISICILIILLYSFIGSKGELIENLNIPIGIGYDLDGTEHKIHILTLEGAEGEKGENVKLKTGVAPSIGETRENRANISSKKFIIGLERVYVLSENQAKSGIDDMLDIWLNNPQVNDRGNVAVCEGKSFDVLSYKGAEPINAAEYLDGILKSSDQFNFFPLQFTLMDLIVRVGAEGRNPVLPYVQITDKGMAITGLALFKNSKMMAKTDLQTAKYINLLKYDKVNGMLTIQKNPEEYINFYAKSRRKVKCSKSGEKYNFIIKLNLSGNVVNNRLYLNMDKDKNEQKKFVKDMEKQLSKTCELYINKIKNEYKFDVLSLGRYAAAKYGRGKGIDWNKEVANSNIQVEVKINVENQGRGKY